MIGVQIHFFKVCFQRHHIRLIYSISTFIQRNYFSYLQKSFCVFLLCLCSILSDCSQLAANTESGSAGGSLLSTITTCMLGMKDCCKVNDSMQLAELAHIENYLNTLMEETKLDCTVLSQESACWIELTPFVYKSICLFSLHKANWTYYPFNHMFPSSGIFVQLKEGSQSIYCWLCRVSSSLP